MYQFAIYYLLFTMFYVLCSMFYVLCSIFYFLFSIFYFLFSIFYFLFAICYLLFAICYLLFAICYLLFTICNFNIFYFHINIRTYDRVNYIHNYGTMIAYSCQPGYSVSAVAANADKEKEAVLTCLWDGTWDRDPDNMQCVGEFGCHHQTVGLVYHAF